MTDKHSFPTIIFLNELLDDDCEQLDQCYGVISVPIRRVKP